jgi:hypothetical protein
MVGKSGDFKPALEDGSILRSPSHPHAYFAECLFMHIEYTLSYGRDGQDALSTRAEEKNSHIHPFAW